MQDIPSKIKIAPLAPGVYFFKDNTGQVLYVGKAKKIRNRLRQYFAKEIGRGPAIAQMVALATDIEWMETESEIEALLLEAELINKFGPKYNVRLRDDKSFLVIRITKEEFPQVQLIRYHDVDFKDGKAWYFGPYPSGELLRKSLRYLRRVFMFRDCSINKFHSYKKKVRNCIFGDIKICSSPCVDKIDKIGYRKNINYLKYFLRGKKKEIEKKLNKEMQLLSKSKNYEAAALIRDQLSALNHLRDVALGIKDDLFDNRIIFKRIECYDLSNIMGLYAVGAMVVFTDGKPDKDSYRRFRIKNNQRDDLSMLREVLERRFKNKDLPLPDLIIIDGGETHLSVAKAVIGQLGIEKPLISISKGAKRDKNDFHFSKKEVAEYIMGNLPMRSIAILARDEAHRFAINYYRNVHRKEMFS